MIDAAPPPPPPPPPPNPPLKSIKTPKSRQKQRDPGGVNSFGSEVLSGSDPEGFELTQMFGDPLLQNIHPTLSPTDLVDYYNLEPLSLTRGLPTPVRSRSSKEGRIIRQQAAHNSENVNESNMPPTPVRCNTTFNKYHTRTSSEKISTGTEILPLDSPSCLDHLERSDLSLVIGQPPPPPPLPPPPPPPSNLSNKSPKKRRNKTPNRNSSVEDFVSSRETIMQPPSPALDNFFSSNKEKFSDRDNIGIEISTIASSSISTITQHTRQQRKDNHADVQDRLIDERLRAAKLLHERIVDPPTGSTHTGRHSISATPRARIDIQSRYRTDDNLQKSQTNNHLGLDDFDKPLIYDEGPIKVITLKSPSSSATRKLQHFQYESSTKAKENSELKAKSTSDSLSKNRPVSQSDLRFSTTSWNDENSNLDTAQKSKSFELSPSQINLAKTSVVTIAPSVESKRDNDYFHPHSTPIVRANVKKYRSKTPEKLRRINENKARLQTPVQKIAGSKTISEIQRSFSNDKSEQSGNASKKGFFRKLFKVNRKKKDKSSDNSTGAPQPDKKEGNAQSRKIFPDVEQSHSLQDHNYSFESSYTMKSEFAATFDDSRITGTIDTMNSDTKYFCNSVIPSSLEDRRTVSTDDHAEQNDLVCGQDEVISTLTLPTVDSYHPVGSGLSKLTISASHSSTGLSAGSVNNTLDEMYRQGPNEDLTFRLLNSSEPQGIYWMKNNRTHDVNERLKKLQNDHYSPSVNCNIHDSQGDVTPKHGNNPRFEYSPNRGRSFFENYPKVAARNVTAVISQDPIGDSPINVEEKIESPTRAKIKAQIKILQGVLNEPSPQHRKHRQSSNTFFNDAVSRSEAPKNDPLSFIRNDTMVQAPDPPLQMECLDDSLECTTTEEEISDYDNNVSEEKNDDKKSTLVTTPSSTITSLQNKKYLSPTNFRRKKTSPSFRQSHQKSPLIMTKSIEKKPLHQATEYSSSADTGQNEHRTIAPHGETDCEHAMKKDQVQIAGLSAKLLSSSGSRPTSRKDALYRLAPTTIDSNTNTKHKISKLEDDNDFFLHIEGSQSENGPIDSDEVVQSYLHTKEALQTRNKKIKNRSHLNVAKAARLNAKAISYIAKLSGDPSPRRLWKQSNLDVDIETPTDTKLSISTSCEVDSKQCRDSVSERLWKPSNSGADNEAPTDIKSLVSTNCTVDTTLLHQSQEYDSSNKDEISPTNPIRFFRNRPIKSKTRRSPANNTKDHSPVCSNHMSPSNKVRHDVGHHDIIISIDLEQNADPIPKYPNQGAERFESYESAKFFSAYNPKFKGRKPILESKKQVIASPRIDTDFRFVTGIPKHLQMVSPRPTLKEYEIITSKAFSKGVAILRENREYDIATGRALRVVPCPKVNTHHTITPEATEPRDPIQRAGRRLLSKAAVPIQTGVRVFLARQKAVDRMWGLLEIQSYMRRWKAEAALLAYRNSVLLIQSVFRGYRIRKAIFIRQNAAVRIQKVVRGFLIAVMTYDLVYRIILVQAQVRQSFARKRLQALREEKKSAIRVAASLKLQAWWRCCSTATLYQYLLSDTTLIQTTIRCWLARRRVAKLLANRRQYAAIKIQKTWRYFTAYTDYIFALVDILVCQRTARIYLSKQKANLLRRERAATKIQTKWRQWVARDIFNRQIASIRIQTKWRQKVALGKLIRHVAAREIQMKWRQWVARWELIRHIAAREIQIKWRLYCHLRNHWSAITIQTKFRQFTAYKTFVISLVYVLMIQRNTRSWLTRRKFKELLRNIAAVKIQKNFRRYFQQEYYLFKLSNILMIQQCSRLFLAKKKCKELRFERSALIIQSQWRRYDAKMAVLRLLVRIIMSQSIARRYIRVKEYSEMRKVQISAIIKIQSIWRRYWDYSHFLVVQYVRERTRRLNALIIQVAWRRKQKRVMAAVKIQSLWRRFWDFSHFVILRYEAVRIQAIIRGKLASLQFNLKLGCCILLQAASRRYLAKMHLNWLKAVAAAKRVQSRWRRTIVSQKKKKAALVIERFFMMIKAEIEREIVRREKKLIARNKQRHRESADEFLERVWSNTVDGSNLEMFSISPSSYRSGPQAVPMISRMRRSVPSDNSVVTSYTGRSINSAQIAMGEKRNISHRPSSPSMNLVMRHDYETRFRRSTRSVDIEEESSIVSGLTYVTNATQQKKEFYHTTTSRTLDPRSQNYWQNDGTLKEPVRQNTDSRKLNESAAEKYKKIYGIKTSAHRSARLHHFFGDDVDSTSSTALPRTPKSLASPTHQGPGILKGYGVAPAHNLTLDINGSPIVKGAKTPSGNRISGLSPSNYEAPKVVEFLVESSPTTRSIRHHSSGLVQNYESPHHVDSRHFETSHFESVHLESPRRSSSLVRQSKSHHDYGIRIGPSSQYNMTSQSPSSMQYNLSDTPATFDLRSDLTEHGRPIKSRSADRRTSPHLSRTPRSAEHVRASSYTMQVTSPKAAGRSKSNDRPYVPSPMSEIRRSEVLATTRGSTIIDPRYEHRRSSLTKSELLTENRPSPRHAHIVVMKPNHDYTVKHISKYDDDMHLGEEYGMI